MVDWNTILVGAALVASSVNSLLTTFMLFSQLNEKMKLLRALHSVSSAMVIAAKKKPHLRRKGNVTGS